MPPPNPTQTPLGRKKITSHSLALNKRKSNNTNSMNAAIVLFRHTSTHYLRRNAISARYILKREVIHGYSTIPNMSTLPDITAEPAPNQHILHDGKEYTAVKEGLAYILIPASASAVPQTTPKGETQPQSVFYNPIQQFNRDLSVLAIKAYGESIWEKKREDKQEALAKKAAKKAAQAERKRKRAEEGSSEASRKAGKLDDGQDALSQAGSEPTTNTEVKDIPPEVTETVEANIEGQDEVPVEEAALNEHETKTREDIEAAAEAAVVESEGQNEAATGAHPTDGESQTKPKPQQPSGPTFTILDALSATGLRALRYAHEIPFTTSVTANDLLSAATKSIKLNVKHNRLEDKIKPVTGNALGHMYSLVGRDNERDEEGKPISVNKYDVIDLDPYGTAAPFLDAAVQAVKDGGLLCVTCTDAGVWASNSYPEKAYSLYGGLSMKGPHSHEGGLRLILHAIATSAARYGLAIEPLLSLSIDFYGRVFVRVYKSALDVKYLAGKTMIVYNCDSGCGAWTTQMLGRNKISPNKNGKGHFYKHVYALAPTASENCKHCGSKTHLAGPMYAGPIHSPEFIKRILDSLPDVSKETYATTTRIEGMLSMAMEETLSDLEAFQPETIKPGTKSKDPAAVDRYPFFFMPASLSKVIHCVTPHENALRGALRHAGYRVTRSHAKGGSIKTDAPWDFVWEMMREWVRQKSPIKEGSIREGTPGYKIMGLDKKDREDAGEEKPKIVFDEKLGAEVDTKKLVRFQVNPRENWGPMNRAKGHA